MIDAQVFAGHLAGPGASAGSRGERAGPAGTNGMGLLPGWAELEPALPKIAAAMRGCLNQIGCVLRLGSAGGS